MKPKTDHAQVSPAMTPAAPATEEPQVSPATSPDIFPEIAAAVRAPASTVTAEESGPAPSRQPGDVTSGIGVTPGKITHLWCYDSAVGSWVYLDGMGWKRLSPASEHGHSHLTILSTLATNANISVYYNLDSTGNIDQLYV